MKTATCAVIGVAILVSVGCGGSPAATPQQSRASSTATQAGTPSSTSTPSASAASGSAEAVANELSSGFTPHAIAFLNATDGIMDGTVIGTGGSTAGVLAYTTDGGTDWHMGLGAGYEDPLDVTVVGTSLAWATVYACPKVTPCHDLLLYSPDGGRTWESPLPNDDPVQGIGEARFADAQNGWALSAIPESTGLLKSADGGRSWKATGTPCAGIVGETPRAVSAPQADAVYVLCAGAGATGLQAKSVVVSHDGGATWQTQVKVSLSARQPVGGLAAVGYGVGVFFLPNGNGYLWESRGGFLTSSDAGKTWQAASLGQIERVEVRSAWFPSETVGFALVQDIQLSDMRLVKTVDGGATWTTLRTWRLPNA